VSKRLAPLHAFCLFGARTLTFSLGDDLRAVHGIPPRVQVCAQPSPPVLALRRVPPYAPTRARAHTSVEIVGEAPRVTPRGNLSTLANVAPTEATQASTPHR